MVISRSFILTLGTGMFCGFFSFYLLNTTVTLHPRYIEGISPPHSIENHAHNHEELENAAGPLGSVSMHSSHEAHHAGESVEAEQLKGKVRVLCWVMTNPKNHEKKARHIKATWARRCNKLLFISSEEDKELGAVALEVGEGRDHLWEKTKAAFVYVYNNHYKDADWFLKADDDTYVIVENLRYMLSPYDADDPMWFGCRFKKYVKQGYMSGGAGYVLSREALRKFVEEAIPNPKKCRQDAGGAEDVEIGKSSKKTFFLYATASKSPPQRLHLGTSTSEPPPQCLHLSSSTAVSPLQRHHFNDSTSALPPRHLNFSTSTLAPPSYCLHLSNSTSAPLIQRLNLSASTSVSQHLHLNATTSMTPPQRFHLNATTSMTPPQHVSFSASTSAPPPHFRVAPGGGGKARAVVAPRGRVQVERAT
ncbi:glycoprotein-N-acetylgalactosamine 3-beta-galactosyltransferase 1-like [Penaeus indicus]|uniref:glycoprotein-N-acetylgalactosamine 3-beta-galactosyltransferase 1-like n=1 Tax=Penaeus indicus TaxID=29960 RepID=UPI00300C180F